MIFPENWDDLTARVMWLINRCKETQRDRTHVCDRRERYYLFGAAGYDPVRYNRIKSHLDLVSSFLYSPDHAFYQIAAQANAPEPVVRQVTALQDEFNEDFTSWGLNDMLMDGIIWSLVYNCMHVKQGWNEVAKEGYATLVSPAEFGVFREDIIELDRQEAFVHTYPLEYYDAVQRLVRAGRGSDVERIATVQEARPMPFPDMLTRLIIAGTGGMNLSGNMLGSVNPDYTPTDNYQARTQHPMVLFDELWAWDSTTNDYRIFHVIEPDIVIGDSKRTVKAMMSVPKMRKLMEEKATRVRRRRRRAGDGELVGIFDTDAPGDDDFVISQSNPFLPGEHPFTPIRPYRKWNYYWGEAHIDALTGLQDWLNERMEQIADILDRQAYPPRVGTGMAGISDEKFAAFGEADSYILEQMPNAKVEELHPQMPPDLFAEVNEIGQFFLEASGLTDVIMGQGAEGVRSKAHAQQAARTGSGRIKKAALALEPSLTRIGDVGIKLMQKNDDTPITPQEAPTFLPAQIASQLRIKVSAHAHSPLFIDDAREMAAVLIKAGAIDKEMLVRMLHPPARDAILHGLQMQQRQQAQMMASLPPEDRIKVMTGGKAGAGGSHRR
jgi:hypothetical protein